MLIKIDFQVNTTRGVDVKTVIPLVRNVADQMSGTVYLVLVLCYCRDRGKGTLLVGSFSHMCLEVFL